MREQSQAMHRKRDKLSAGHDLGGTANGRFLIRKVFRYLQGWKLEGLYASVTIICGLILIYWDRRPARNDDRAHLGRLRQLASGTLLPVQSPDGSDLYGYWRDGIFRPFNNTAVNSPVAYYPSILAFRIHWNDYLLACIFTLVCSTLTATIAIHVAMRYRYVICAAALLPAVFFSFLYVTTDAVINSLSLLFVAIALRLHQRAEVTWPQTILITVLAPLVALTKTTSVVLLAMLFLPVIAVWRERHIIRWRMLLPLASGSAACLVWQRMTSHIPPILGTDFTLERYQDAQQLLVSHPLEFLQSLLITLVQPLDFNKKFDKYNSVRNLQFFAGSEKAQLPTGIMLLIFVAIVLLLVKNNINQHEIHWQERTIMGFMIAGFYVLTCAAMLLVGSGLLTTDKLGAYADGMQNRYFIPVLAPMALMLPDFGLTVKRSHVINATIASCLVLGYAGIVCAHVIAFPKVVA
ncbi:DUF2142 domain-containing protein [Bifidobacterium callitrichidarum]|nr:DUF2142 domain-containing protein [Bifidobacterium callitrichidarum]